MDPIYINPCHTNKIEVQGTFGVPIHMESKPIQRLVFFNPATTLISYFQSIRERERERESCMKKCVLIRQGHGEYALQIRGRQCGCVDNCVDDTTPKDLLLVLSASIGGGEPVTIAMGMCCWVLDVFFFLFNIYFE